MPPQHFTWPSVILLLLLIPHAFSHNWMTSPPPYSPRTFNCDDGQRCSNACPISSSPGSPVATYRRGQTIRITWNRNNHHGGLYRIALVPLNLRYDRPAHTRFTLKHGCWETGEHDCAPNEDCGTDRGREAYSTTLQVPTVYPDGIYVMGYVWYGGLRFQRDLGLFSDYYSCAVVRVQGGARLGGTYRAFFEAGEGRRIENGKCRTSADAIGDCESGCEQKRSFVAIPRVFREGGLPPFNAADVASSMGAGQDLGERSSGSNGSSSDGEEEDENAGDERGSSQESGSDQIEQGPRSVDRGVCSGRVCCASQCGRCGGRGCHRLPGGGNQCCSSTISRSGRLCTDTVGAPCIRG